MNSYSLCVAVTCACLALGNSALADVSGIARVIDGDTDINEWLVLNGWAVAYTYYSYDYSRAEAFAKSERSGVWAGEFVMPWEWRREQRN